MDRLTFSSHDETLKAWKLIRKRDPEAHRSVLKPILVVGNPKSVVCLRAAGYLFTSQEGN